jgi:hypothetical protein
MHSFKAKVILNDGTSTDVMIQARDMSHASQLLEAQYGRGNFYPPVRQ